ncbi:Choline/Carnitine o-acyltransferase-domain-containing protein [Xylogone sp. PMI_703]|nr:Choline/Carnitine o-acyltransferase-domain-containing protein [Xylogone sp. PMI_703]
MAEQAPIPIAVIGMACRLPGGSDSPEKLWDMLVEGRSGWCEIPEDRWNKESFYHPDPEAKEAINVKGLYFLKQDIAAFDARFFGIHPHEAHCLDPQQRILMETTYEALENAGITLQKIKGSDTSVHVGAYATDFERMGYKDISRVPKLHMIGSGLAILSNRISYLFDLKGASSTIDTGCSGSMVALHQACLGLRAGESQMAIVAGTQLLLAPDQIIPMSMVGMTNPDGRCYVFDHRGSGYARGEGVVSFILKRLDDAVRDGDNVHAIIRNSGLNQDGKTAGISLPNPVAQANLMRYVYKNAGLDPKDTAYVEAHGTGTQAGDSAEISSIGEVFCLENQRQDNVYVGSIKSNIGHLEAASGVAGLMKAILILKHGMIPPNIDFEKPKPTLHLEERRIKIATEMVPLPSTGPRRVSVNSFGYGGTNAHVILEAPYTTASLSESKAAGEANGNYNGNGSISLSDGSYHNGLDTSKSNGHSEVDTYEALSFHLATNGTNGTNGANGTNGIYNHAEATIDLGATSNGVKSKPINDTNGYRAINGKMKNNSDTSYSPQLFVLSARSESSLQAMVENLDRWVSTRGRDGYYLRDLAYTLASRRTAMQFRFSTAAATHPDLLTSLGQKPRVTKIANDLHSVFLFTGQGAQWHAMGKELMASRHIFRNSILKSDQLLKDLGSTWSLIDELSKDVQTSRVGQAEISQPSTTAIQIALVDLLQSIGVLPDNVLGHSSGEIAAAYAAGILDQKTALEISYHRGFMSQASKRVISSKGAMMAVGLGEVEIAQYIEQTRSGLVSVACVNSPVSTTISGDESAIDELKGILDEASIFNRKLKVDTAYHSHHMKKVAAEYLQSIAHIKAGTPKPLVKFYSSVTSTQKFDGFDAQYWVDNLVSKVRFSNALELMCRKDLASSGEANTAPLNLFLEIGPHSALAGPVRQVIQNLNITTFKSSYIPTLVRDRNATVALLETTGKLFEVGYPVSLEVAMASDDQAGEPTTIADLDPYPWDHSTSYWMESNLSKLHRFRAHPPHDLLGLRVTGTTNHEPTWRNLLCIDTLPWLRDHVVDGFIIFPGAAYLCMVIEAVRQISTDRQISGVMSQILFKNVSFSKAIVIPERRPDGLTPDVEVQLTLRPERNLNDRTWESFRIMALSADDIWSEHCSGSVMVEWTPKPDEVEGIREEEMTAVNQLQKLQSMKDACDSYYSGEELYKSFAANGNVFGPMFSNVQDADIGPHVGVSEVIIPDISSVMPRKYMQPHLIHPATFDAISHLGMPLYRRSSGNGPVMPTGMDEVTINCKNISNKPGTKWVVATAMHSEGPRSAIMNTMVFEETEAGSLVLAMNIQGGTLRGIGEAPSDETSLPFHRKMSYQIKWQPDVDFIPKIQSGTLSEDMVEYLKLLTFKHPHMNILEIGAGTGGATLPLIQSLNREEGVLFDRYHYTDISAGFFEQGKALLQKWIERIDFKTLDISKDPVQQGFQAGSYDLIIASNVLHATSFLNETVANSRKLLKPGGRLILIELTRLTAHINWDTLLKQQGFDGLEIAEPDHEGPTARSSMMVSRATVPQAALQPEFPSIEVICQSKSLGFQTFASDISTYFIEKGFPCSVVDWSFKTINLKTIYIVLDDVVQPVLVEPSEERFAQVVQLVTKVKNVLWLSGQYNATELREPVKGLVTGLARVVRRENEGMRFVTLDVQQDVGSPGILVSVLYDIISKSFSTPINTIASDEDEYTFRDNQLLIPRISADQKFEDWVKKTIYTQGLETGLFQQPDRPLKLEVETPGLLSSLRFVDDDLPSKEMGPWDLELEAKAHGINFKDVFIAMGQMVPGVTMAGECSGVVRRVGSALADQFAVGDRVCGIGAEPFSSCPRVNGYFSYQMPDSMSYSTGASIPVIFTTAYYCIVEVARLQPGQTILIHAASGGVGQAAIQLAQNIGAEIFCTVGSNAKRQLLIDTFNIPPSHIFSSRLRTFKQGVLRLTNNKGVDCVLNSLSGEWLHDSFAVLAPLGTFVEIGKTDIYRKNQISMIPFDRNVTFAAVDLTVLGRLKPVEMRERLGKVLSMFEEGILKPVEPITAVPMTDIEEAFRLIQSRKHTGKVVVVCDDQTPVKLTSARPSPLRLRRDATYIIAGGLGDLGRRSARFLAAHGAGHVVTLSRRRLKEEDKIAFEKEMRNLGAKLHIMACDITNPEMVQEAAVKCSIALPPVRGIIHGGMVLRDHPFEQMSLIDYMTAVKPKVHGTQNLERSFGSFASLDFFIMLSSITSILGKTGQSNYSVGNAYQDAFAQSRISSKCKYISLNLGAVDGSEAITSLSSAQQEFMKQGSVLMSFDEVFKVMEYSMSPQANIDGLTQLILGFDRKSMEAVHDEYALANPIFGQIPYLNEKEATTEQATMDVEKLLQQATSVEEVQRIVINAICERFALFTARSVDEISSTVSLEEFGIDSLVAIELKNWLVRTFQVSVQTSEVVDAPSIASLGKLIASRSKIVSADIGGNNEVVGSIEQDAVTVESATLALNHHFHCCRAAKVLPKLPLVDFDTLFEDYLKNTRMFLTDEEFESLSKDVEEFKKPGGIGRTFYNRLFEQAHNPEIENWQDKYFLESIYLGRRMPLAPFSSFMAFHPLSKIEHSQAQRAALIASIAFKCKQDLEADRWEPMEYLGTPNCTDLWNYIFNTARLPGVPLDTMAKFPGNDYVAVLHRGHIFKIMLKSGDEAVSFEQLVKIFQAILDRDDTSENWTSILTADNRTKWAEIRDALTEQNEANRECIHMVEAAAFLVCLDDTSPADPEGRIEDMMMREGFNRWVDKSVSFVICKNAISGTYVEHTMIDAMTLTKMQTAICDGIMSYEPPLQINGHSNGYTNGQIQVPKEFSIHTTPEIDSRILEIRQKFKEDLSKFGYRDLIIPQFGKNILLERGLPIKGIFDLMCQLANYYFYGRCVQSWEAISMSHYHKGRPDIVQVVTPIIAEFCSTVDDDNLPLSTRFQRMVDAAHDHNQTIKDALTGHCYQRTLRALELCAEKGEELPSLFKNPLYEGTVEPEQMFSNTDGLSPQSCFIMQDPKKYWMTYYVSDEWAHFSVVTGKEQVIEWSKCLERAASIMKVLLDVA